MFEQITIPVLCAIIAIFITIEAGRAVRIKKTGNMEADIKNIKVVSQDTNTKVNTLEANLYDYKTETNAAIAEFRTDISWLKKERTRK